MYEISEAVALTILLHASKYPSCTVNGVLLGKQQGEGFMITAVIPLFHRSHVLAPCVETALAQVRAVGSRLPAGGRSRTASRCGCCSCCRCCSCSSGSARRCPCWPLSPPTAPAPRVLCADLMRQSNDSSLSAIKQAQPNPPP